MTNASIPYPKSHVQFKLISIQAMFKTKTKIRVNSSKTTRMETQKSRTQYRKNSETQIFRLVSTKLWISFTIKFPLHYLKWLDKAKFNLNPNQCHHQQSEGERGDINKLAIGLSVVPRDRTCTINKRLDGFKISCSIQTQNLPPNTSNHSPDNTIYEGHHETDFEYIWQLDVTRCCNEQTNKSIDVRIKGIIV